MSRTRESSATPERADSHRRGIDSTSIATTDAIVDRAVADALRACRPELRRMAAQRIGARLARYVDASDVVQEVMLRALRYLERSRKHIGRDGSEPAETDRSALAGAGSPAAPHSLTASRVSCWLRRILCSVLVDSLRRHGLAQRRDWHVERRLEQSGTFLHARDLAEPRSHEDRDRALQSPRSTPSQHAARREQLAVLTRAVEQLPPHYRQVLQLRHWEGLGFDEIAARTGRSVESVKHIWIRALAALRRGPAGRHQHASDPT